MPELYAKSADKWQLITRKHLRTSLLQLVIYMFLTRVMGFSPHLFSFQGITIVGFTRIAVSFKFHSWFANFKLT